MKITIAHKHIIALFKVKCRDLLNDINTCIDYAAMIQLNFVLRSIYCAKL